MKFLGLCLFFSYHVVTSALESANYTGHVVKRIGVEEKKGAEAQHRLNIEHSTPIQEKGKDLKVAFKSGSSNDKDGLDGHLVTKEPNLIMRALDPSLSSKVVKAGKTADKENSSPISRISYGTDPLFDISKKDKTGCKNSEINTDVTFAPLYKSDQDLQNLQNPLPIVDRGLQIQSNLLPVENSPSSQSASIINQIDQESLSRAKFPLVDESQNSPRVLTENQLNPVPLNPSTFSSIEKSGHSQGSPRALVTNQVESKLLSQSNLSRIDKPADNPPSSLPVDHYRVLQSQSNLLPFYKSGDNDQNSLGALSINQNSDLLSQSQFPPILNDYQSLPDLNNNNVLSANQYLPLWRTVFNPASSNSKPVDMVNSFPNLRVPSFFDKVVDFITAPLTAVSQILKPIPLSQTYSNAPMPNGGLLNILDNIMRYIFPQSLKPVASFQARPISPTNDVPNAYQYSNLFNNTFKIPTGSPELPKTNGDCGSNRKLQLGPETRLPARFDLMNSARNEFFRSLESFRNNDGLSKLNFSLSSLMSFLLGFDVSASKSYFFLHNICERIGKFLRGPDSNRTGCSPLDILYLPIRIIRKLFDIIANTFGFSQTVYQFPSQVFSKQRFDSDTYPEVW